MTLHYESLVFCWHLQIVYLLDIWCWHICFLFFVYLFIYHMNKIEGGFLLLYLGVSSVYATSMNVFNLLLTTYQYCVCVFCNVVL